MQLTFNIVPLSTSSRIISQFNSSFSNVYLHNPQGETTLVFPSLSIFTDTRQSISLSPCKIRDIKDTRELVEDELNDLLAKKEKESM